MQYENELKTSLLYVIDNKPIEFKKTMESIVSNKLKPYLNSFVKEVEQKIMKEYK